MKAIKRWLKDWLGVTELENCFESLEEAPDEDLKTLVTKEMLAILNESSPKYTLFGGRTAAGAFHEALDRVIKEATKPLIDAGTKNVVSSEDVIDAIVERINRKQLGK